MQNFLFTDKQLQAIDAPIQAPLFIEGPPMCGKSTAGVARLRKILLSSPQAKVMILIPQKSLASPYIEFLRNQNSFGGRAPATWTISGLARHMTQLFWPLISAEAGFNGEDQHPHFLSLETAQFIMSEICQPFIQKGYFNSITIERPRLYSQILDNLNKSAIIPFEIEEIAPRLKATTGIDPSFTLAYDQAQECAVAFRNYCLTHNLLDFSLLIDTFRKFIFPHPIYSNHFRSMFNATIVDNVEEDFPVSHDFIHSWMEIIPSTTVIYDHDGGYRSFLGADPQNAFSLKRFSTNSISFQKPIHSQKQMESFRMALGACIRQEKILKIESFLSNSFQIDIHRYFPQMIAAVCSQIADLITTKKVAASDITILAPYLSDAVKFSFNHHLDLLKIPHTAIRPSQNYCNNPVIQTFLTFAKLAHPTWQFNISPLRVRNLLSTVIPDLDIARANLMVQIFYSRNEKRLRSFDDLQNNEMRERITFAAGEKFENLQKWVAENCSQIDEPLDVFWGRLFSEFLSKRQYAFFKNFESADMIHKLIKSASDFRKHNQDLQRIDINTINQEYVRVIEEGLLPASFLNQTVEEDTGVKILPAHSFLMQNKSCKIQFWLDVGSLGWWERLNQPLTNPYLLRKNPVSFQNWTDADEFRENQSAMHRVVIGLARRCSEKVFIHSVDINEYGNEFRGPLLQAIQSLKKWIILNEGTRHV